MIYLAGPLFTAAEREFNIKIFNSLKKNINEKIFLPQQECENCKTPDEIFQKCRKGIDESRIIIAILDGSDSDSGTSFEIGYAFAKKIPIIGIRTDFRQNGDDGGLNLMLSKSCSYLCNISSLKNDDIIPIITKKLQDLLSKQ